MNFEGDPGGSWFNVCFDGVVSPTLKIIKVSQGGTGTFTFNGNAGNANGFSTDSSYKITTTTPGTALAGSVVNLSAANAVTEIQEALPSGWAVASASCVDTNAGASGNVTSTFGVLTGNVLQIPAAFVLGGANLECTFTNTYTGLALSGKVILDIGAGSGGVAHNAIQDGVEPGQPGVVVSLTDCANKVYSTTTTKGDGTFSLSLASAPLSQPACLVQSVPNGYQAVSVNAGNTGGTGYNAGTTTLSFTPTGITYNNVVLGNAPLSSLVSDGTQQTTAGSAVVYAHTYVAGSAGSVQFSTTEAPNPASLVWNSVTYRDINCDGQLDGGDTVLTTSVNVAAGDRLCLLHRVFTPSAGFNGVFDNSTFTATESWTTATLPANQIHVLKNVDLTTVSSAGLTLIKEVRTLTGACPSSASESLLNTQTYSVGGNARPGASLEYRLRYSNNTAAPLTGVEVHDTVPYYTIFKTALCLSTPTRGISGCTVAAPASGATTGAVAWTMGDTGGAVTGLQPQDGGTVSYCVQVQNN